MKIFLNKNTKEEALSLLHKGEIIILPTETIFGFFVRADTKKSIESLYDLKKREMKKPFTLHTRSIEDSIEYAEIDETLFLTLENFCPGPLTVIVPKKEKSLSFVGTEKNIGVRVVAHPLCQEILSLCPFPVVGTSVNISQTNTLETVQDIEKYFPHIPCYCDTYNQKLSLPSTIIDTTKTPFSCLREGKISFTEFMKTFTQMKASLLLKKKKTQ
jgi:L-threonylcarbamoyladenylate synthase